jgi:hypothetical protein
MYRCDQYHLLHDPLREKSSPRTGIPGMIGGHEHVDAIRKTNGAKLAILAAGRAGWRYCLAAD